MLLVPADGRRDAGLEALLRTPVELAGDLAGVDRVPPIVSRTVGDTADERGRLAERFQDHTCDRHVLALVAAADAFVQAYATTFGVPAVITRCSNNYGPYQFPEKLIPLFVTNALDGEPLPLYGDGQNVRDWIHVADHCDAIWHVLGLGITDGRVFNVSAHAETPNREVTDAILRLTGRGPDLVRHVTDRPGHDRRYALDAGRLRATGWAPRRAFADGLAETVAWYRDNRPWWEAVKSGAYREYYRETYGARLRDASAAPPATSRRS